MTIAPAPSVPAMAESRMASFRARVASRLRTGALSGQAESAVIGQIVVEQVALAKALADHDFVHAMASAYIEEMGKQQPNPAYAIPMAQAHVQMESILSNRIADATQCVALLADPTFIASARAQATKPEPIETPYQLPPGKIAETVRRLVQPLDSDGPEPAIHVALSITGQRMGHEALAAIFNPDGPLRAPMVHALAKAWPQGTGDVFEGVAASWLKARQEPAMAVAEGLKTGGAIFTEAMRQAALLQQKKHVRATPAAIPVMPAAVPTQVINGAKMHNGTVREIGDLAMEVV